MKIKDAYKIISFYENELRDAPCSSNHHLNVRGGLMMHLSNVRDIAQEMYPLDETLIALSIVHDIGKARTYKIEYNDMGNDVITYSNPSVDHLINTIAMISEFGYKLTQEELHALQYHHGGWSPFAHKASLSELAIKLHTADMLATARENKR